MWHHKGVRDWHKICHIKQIDLIATVTLSLITKKLNSFVDEPFFYQFLKRSSFFIIVILSSIQPSQITSKVFHLKTSRSNWKVTDTFESTTSQFGWIMTTQTSNHWRPKEWTLTIWKRVRLSRSRVTLQSMTWTTIAYCRSLLTFRWVIRSTLNASVHVGDICWGLDGEPWTGEDQHCWPWV